jgi:hypothetical protein
MQLLRELLNTVLPYDVTVDEGDRWRAEFQAGDRTIRFSAEAFDDDNWEVSFGERREGDPSWQLSMDVTGSGQATAVLATVAAILRDFVQERSPDSIAFTSEKSDRSRTSVYARILRRFAEDAGWTYELDKTASDYRDYFTLRPR